MMARTKPTLIQGSIFKPTIGIIDIGSNNCNLSIYGAGHDDKLHKMKFLGDKVPCQLAQGIWSHPPRLREKNLEHVVQTIGAFRDVLTHHGIPAKNTLMVVTEAMNAIAETPKGQEDIARLITGDGHWPAYIFTGEEQAIANAIAINLSFPQELMRDQKRCATAFAAIGGGGMQFGTLSPWNVISDVTSLPYGIFRIMEESGENVDKARAILTKVLATQGPDFKEDNLITLGRQWRALGDVVCEEESRVLKGGNIRQALVDVAHNKIKLHHPRKRVRECKPYLPFAAVMLECVTQRFKTKQLAFYDRTVRGALARTLYDLRTGRAPMPPAGLSRLFSHLTP